MDSLTPIQGQDVNSSDSSQKGNKVCSGCGAANAQSFKYCFNCGLELPTEVDTLVAGSPAGFWRRFWAFIIDTILIIVLITAFSKIFKYEDTSLTSYVVSSIVYIGYWTIAPGRWGRTLGKAILGLKVMRNDGSKLTYWRSFGRYWAYALSSLPLGLGFIAIALSAKKRGFHDFVCDTKVVKIMR